MQRAGRGLAVGARLLACLALAACSADNNASQTPAKQAIDAGADAQVAGDVEYLSPTEHLTRASMALRGLHPSLEELAAVRKDPGYVAAIVDYYLQQPELGEVMRELHAESLLVGVDPDPFTAFFSSRA